MNHATGRLGDYQVPLIGIDQSATEEKCDWCHRTYHLSEIRLNRGGFMCWSCLIKERIKAKVINYLPQNADHTPPHLK